MYDQKWEINSLQKHILFTEQIDNLMLFERHRNLYRFYMYR